MFSSASLTLPTDSTINVSHANGVLTIAGAVSGPGTLTKIGLGKLVLSNGTLAGASVRNGVLAITGSDVISDDGDLSLMGGTLDIADGLNETVSALYLGGMLQGPGTYGRVDSGAEFEIAAYFTGGMGILTAGTPPPTIQVFTITDQSTGSPRFTNSALVDVFISAMGGGGDIDGYLVTTSDVAPTEGWLPEAPTTATLTTTGDVTLYAWVRNTLGATARKAATIHYDTTTPEVSNVAIAAGDPGTAVVTWNTNVATLGSVKYAVQGTGDWTTVSESELATAHSVTITGIADGTTYQVVIINNEIEQPAMLYPKGWPIPGDCNGDCRVNILDLIFIRNRLNQDVYTGENWKADVNEDNRVNILDLIFVRNRLNTMCQ